MWTLLKQSYLRARWTARLYVLGLVVVVADVLWPGPPHSAALSIAGAAFAAGFLTWAWRPMARWWSHPVGKLFITLAHLGVLLVVHVLARRAVAAATGLPPDDFESSIYVLSFLLYLPVWAFGVTIVASAASIALFFYGMFASAVRKPEAGFVVWGHAIGALALTGFLGLVHGAPLQTAEPPWWVPGIIYEVDYHPLPNFPGVPEGAHAKVHENGWISIAHASRHAVTFEVVRSEQVESERQ